MPTAERLYYHDSRLLEFDARVTDVSEREDGAIAITLDRTAFYPTGGGQPHDTGTIGDARVVDCIDAEESGILHVLQGPTPEVGDTIHGKVDWLRRLDHMQQHTGQHILSSAFVKLFDAPTRSFRMLEHECEIDVALDNPTDEKIAQAVNLANQIIWESRPITIRQVAPEEAAALPLRKEPAREGELRVIEISEFDLTPCGGTHARSTGEVGVIAVRSWVRAKGLTRIQFLAGIRVVNDYRKANRTAVEVASLFSSGRDDSPALVSRLMDENKKLARRVRELGEIACRVEADEVLSATATRLETTDRPITSDPRLEAGYRPPASDRAGVTDSSRGLSANRDTPGFDPEVNRDPEGVTEVFDVNEQSVSAATATGSEQSIKTRIISRVFDDRDANSLKQLALALIAHPKVIALLGSRDGNTARLVFARSPDAPMDMNLLMKKACETINGRGGGKPDMAQGGGQDVDKLDAAIASAADSLS